MSGTLNRDAYVRLLDEDLSWLLTCPRTLERDHIEAILRWVRDHRYEFEFHGNGDLPPCTDVQPTKAATSVQVAELNSAIAGAVGTRPMDVDESACEQLDRILNEPSKSTIVPKDITG